MDGRRGAPRLLRRLRARIIAVAIVTTAFAVAAFSLSLTYLALDATEIRLSDLLQSAMQGPAGNGCQQAPAAFGIQGEHQTTLFAYDALTLESANPQAPPLLPSQKRTIEAMTPGQQSTSEANIGSGAYVVTKVSDSGPCSLLVVSWVTEPALPWWRIASVAALFLLILGTAAGAGLIFVLRPTLERIGRLSQAAANVGHASYRPGRSDDDELGKIEVALDKAHTRIVDDAEEIQRRHHALTEHLEHVAHDLRTPIASLQLKLERLGGERGDDDRNALVTEAMEDALYMGGLADNLRVAARLQDGLDPSAPANESGPRPEADLVDVVERVGARARVLAERKNIVLEWARPDTPCAVQCQPTMATQLVQNLVQNAVAYGDEGGHVAIVLEVSNGRFTLRVLDDGPGVPPEDLPRLVGRTFRTDAARARDGAGTGLGLAIANEIALRCGFQMAFEANAPRGLVVTLRGPLVSA